MLIYLLLLCVLSARGEGIDQEAGQVMVQDDGVRFRVHRVRELHQVVGRLPVNRILIVWPDTDWICSMAFLLASLYGERGDSRTFCKNSLLMRHHFRIFNTLVFSEWFASWQSNCVDDSRSSVLWDPSCSSPCHMSFPSLAFAMWLKSVG